MSEDEKSTEKPKSKTARTKKSEEEGDASVEKWKMIREFVTGPNLKWFLAMIVIIALVGASMFSGKVFTVSQGGIVFGATQVEPTPEEGDELLHDTAAAAAPVEAEPTVVTRVVEKIVEVPAPPPPGFPPPPPPGYPPPPADVEPEPEPEPVVEPEPIMEPEPEPLPE